MNDSSVKNQNDFPFIIFHFSFVIAGAHSVGITNNNRDTTGFSRVVPQFYLTATGFSSVDTTDFCHVDFQLLPIFTSNKDEAETPRLKVGGIRGDVLFLPTLGKN